MKIFWVYILYSPAFRQTYVGQTQEIHKRLERHNSGNVLSTKRYLPWEKIYTEPYQNRSEAMKREKYLKSGTGREEVKTFLQQYLSQNR